MQKVTFLGLGVMGAPMAGHLSKAGFAVTVYNRSAEKASAWLQTYDGKAGDSPYAAAEGAEVVVSCAGDDDSVRALCLGNNGTDGAFAAMAPGSIYIDHTTTSADLAREMSAAAKQQGIEFIDAPVSGGQVGAENGQLTIMAGGDAEAYARAQPVLNAYAKASTRMGESGAGQLTKMVNQICIAGLVQALSEALAFSEKAGLDSMQVLSVVSTGVAQSWQMQNRGPTMLKNEFDFGFAVDHMRKDLGICMNEARQNGAQLPVTELVDQFYAEVQASGGNRFDTSSLITRLNQ